MILQPQSTNHNSHPQKQFFLVSNKNCDLWKGLPPEVWDLQTSHHSVHAQSQVWQIWLVKNMKRILWACSEKWTFPFWGYCVWEINLIWIIVISRMIMVMMKHNRKQADWRLSSMIFCFRFQRELYDVSEDKLTCPWKVMRILVKVMLYNVA